MDADNFKSDFPSPRLESADVGGPDGKTIVLKIVAIKGEITEGSDSKPKQVMTFEPVRGIDYRRGDRIVPKTEWLYGITVARCLAAMFGDKKSGWIGKRVAVKSELVESFGEMVPALRPIGSPDIEKAITFTVPKGRGKVKMTMRGPSKQAPATAKPQTDETTGETVPPAGDA